jgi:hypothetical protein
MDNRILENIDEPEIMLLREWLPKLSVEYRAFIKGAEKALLYVQETGNESAVSETNISKETS